MLYRQLGSSDLRISEISLGSWLTYGVGVDAGVARQCLDAAFDAGINFIDTANIYGRGAAEEFLGEALASRPRDTYVLGTKLFAPMSDEDKGLSRGQIYKQIDASLKRLRTDYVDLYQCHRYDEETPLEETMEALSEIVRAGKVRYIGFSEWSVEQIHASLSIKSVEKFVSSQPQYSLLHRDPEHEVMPLCAANGISQITWSPLAQGVLTGKYPPDTRPPEGSRATSPEMGEFIGGFLKLDLLRAIEDLKEVAQEADLTLAQFALAWVLREPNVASAITGASRPEQVLENAQAAGQSVNSRLFARAEKIIEEAKRATEISAS
ncbi:MAG: aldo/keto reductase family protein [Sphingomonas sp.]|nr:aldo/keto reductase family protein [Sphingomonas sp.]